MTARKFMLDGYEISSDNANFKPLLARAYKNKQRPLCACKSPGVEMYIASLKGEYILKRMPNTGSKHHPECPSFEIPAELSGRGQLDDKSIQEDLETGLTKLKLDFALSTNSAERAPVEPSDDNNKEVSADPNKLTIRSLLHFLYEEAGFNKWSPGMRHKRSWGIIYKYLKNQIESTVSKKINLNDILLMPAPFSIAQKDANMLDRKKLLRHLKSNSSPSRQKKGILLGELKNIEPAKFGHRMSIKHMPELYAYLPGKMLESINKKFAIELAFFAENPDIHVFVIASFLVSQTNSPIIDTLSMMMVDSNYLPFEGSDDLEIISDLVASDTSFIKPLRYNLALKEPLPAAIVTDKENSTAIYTQLVSETPDFTQKANDFSEAENYKIEIR